MLAAAAELLVDTGVVTVEEVVVDITWQNAQGQMETSRRIAAEQKKMMEVSTLTNSVESILLVQVPGM